MSETETNVQKGRALDLVLDAWDKALAEGVEPEVVASVAIYAALVDLIDRFGAEAVADFCTTLPDRIRGGEFTLADGEAR